MKRHSPSRAVGYVRVSTEEQVDGHSLEAQRVEIERYAKQQGLTLVGIYADEGVSAHTDRIEKRPQLSALLADASHGSFDVVLVHTIDRWARNVRVQIEALQRLGDAHVGFVSLTENMDYSTPSGKLMLTMIGAFSEFFSDQLGVHVVKSQRQRAENGLPVGPVPFGYITDEESGTPSVDEREGEAVQRAFTMRASGQSNGAIAEWLNREGFETRTGRNFTAHAVKDMLNCRFYLGVVKFRDDRSTSRSSTRRSSSACRRGGLDAALGCVYRRKSGARSRESSAVLDAAMRCTPIETASALRCTASATVGLARPTRAPSSLRLLMSRWGHCSDRSSLSEDWRRWITKVASQDEGPSVSVLLERRQRLARAYADGGYSLAEYEARMSALDAEIRLADQETPVDVEEVASLLTDLPAMWSEARPDERRRLLASLVNDVFVDGETKRIAGIAPHAPFKTLIDSAMRAPASFQAVLIAPNETPALGEYGLGGDGGESNSPSSVRRLRIYYGCSAQSVSLTGAPLLTPGSAGQSQ